MSNKKQLKISFPIGFGYPIGLCGFGLSFCQLSHSLNTNEIDWERCSDGGIIIKYTDELQLFEIGYRIGTDYLMLPNKLK